MARKSLYLCIADGSVVKVHLVQEHCNSTGVTVMEARRAHSSKNETKEWSDLFRRHWPQKTSFCTLRTQKFEPLADFRSEMVISMNALWSPRILINFSWGRISLSKHDLREHWKCLKSMNCFQPINYWILDQCAYERSVVTCPLALGLAECYSR